MRRATCRICDGATLAPVLDLGTTPLANAFLTTPSPSTPEPRYPLEVVRCPACTLVQLAHTVPTTAMFRDYIYVTGTSTTMAAHFAKMASDLTARFRPHLVVEAGSNDGTLLRAFPKEVRTIGVEPAKNIAAVAQGRGVEVVNEFFSEAVCRDLRARAGAADLILGTNVFAHVDDLHDFVRGVHALLADDGSFVVEVPYLFDMLDHLEFDTIYHEHLSYYSLTALVTLMRRHDLEVVDVEHQPVHGGTVRVFSARRGRPSKAVQELLADEERRGVHTSEPYDRFAASVLDLRERLLALLGKLRRDGARIAGYGSPAKGNTLLNYLGIDQRTIEYLVDRSPLKQGKFTPGTHLPIYPAEKLVVDRPDYTLILAWNFRDEILAQQADYTRAGGRFIVPLPRPEVLAS
jgi:SAM-dependent methyltransferase